MVQQALVRGVRLFELIFHRRTELGRPLPAPVNHPRPVIIVAGFANTVNSTREWHGALKRDGFSVFVFDDPVAGLGDITQAADGLSRFVRQVLLQTGAKQVDIIGYSAGGIVARSWMTLQGGAPHVHRLVTVASPHNGTVGTTWFKMLSKGFLLGPLVLDTTPQSQRQLSSGSYLMQRLRAAELPENVDIISIYNPRGDGVIWPPSSSRLDGATNIEVRGRGRLLARLAGTSHFGLAHWSGSTYELIRDELTQTTQSAKPSGKLQVVSPDTNAFHGKRKEAI